MLQTNDEDLKEQVRNWAIKKMPTQFLSWKKKIVPYICKEELDARI
jgi:hypothetical protein